MKAKYIISTQEAFTNYLGKAEWEFQELKFSEKEKHCVDLFNKNQDGLKSSGWVYDEKSYSLYTFHDKVHSLSLNDRIKIKGIYALVCGITTYIDDDIIEYNLTKDVFLLY